MDVIMRRFKKMGCVMTWFDPIGGIVNFIGNNKSYTLGYEYKHGSYSVYKIITREGYKYDNIKKTIICKESN